MRRKPAGQAVLVLAGEFKGLFSGEVAGANVRIDIERIFRGRPT